MVWVAFAGYTAILVAPAVMLAKYGDAIGVRTGLGGLFVGTLLISAATSLPELLTGVSAISAGEPDLLAGNLFGSNILNMSAFGLIDLFSPGSRLFASISASFAHVGLLSVVLMSIALVGNLSRPRPRRLLIDGDAALIRILYGLGLYYLYSQGIRLG